MCIGEDAIDHTPKNESVKLVLGQAFDVTARGKQTDFSVIADNVYESGYAIVFKNAKTEPVTVTMSQYFPGDWQVTAESAQHVKADASTANWTVVIPAEGSATLSYKVRVKY